MAPHPDDEALGTGGLLQQAKAQAAQIVVVFVTDGDNNPWPQRWVERRWFINADCCKRWGAMRRQEALRSIKTLGLEASDAQFLGYPDAGLLRLWRKRDKAVLADFVRVFSEFNPTHLVLPSALDAHSDHRAVHAFALEALRVSRLSPMLTNYLIHKPWFKGVTGGITMHLSSAEQEIKLSAILCHGTQMHLSRSRFVAYAKPEEIFFAEALPTFDSSPS